MSLTRAELEEIVTHGTGQQQLDAVALLEKMKQKTAVAKSPEGTVKLWGFKGETYSLPGGNPCPNNHPNRMSTWVHDIPPRVISSEYAAELRSRYGDEQSGDAQSMANYEFSFGRNFSHTDAELAIWHSKFPTEPREPRKAV